MTSGEAVPREKATSRPSNGLVCTLVTAKEAIAALRDSWDELRASLPFPSPYTDWRYVEAWLATFGVGALAVFAVVCDESQVLAILPLFTERVGPLSFGLRRLRPVGYNGWLGPDDMTEEPIALFRPGHVSRSLDAAIQSLRALKEWDVLILRGLGSHYGKDYEAARKSAGGLCLPVKVKKGPTVVDLPDTWDEYRKQLSKSMRDNLAYYPRLLERRGHRWQVRTVHEGPELDIALDHLIRLHDARTREAGTPRSHHLPTELQVGLLRQIHASLGSQGKAFVALLEADGEVVAAQSFYEDSGSLLVNYSGFDGAWAHFAPLFVLQGQIFRQAQERGVRRLDFLKGDRAWQTRWKGRHVDDLAHLVVFRANPRSLFRSVGYAARFCLMSILPR